MAVIEGGKVITGNRIEGSKPRTYYGTSAPVAGTTYAGMIAPGDLFINVSNGNVYEYTEPGAVPTFTRIDTV